MHATNASPITRGELAADDRGGLEHKPDKEFGHSVPGTPGRSISAMHRNVKDLACWSLQLPSASSAATAQPAERADACKTNQAYVEEVTRPTTLDVDDPMAVFGFVLAQLPERVKVYPTENYYYFGFIHRRHPLCGQHPARRQQPRRRQGGLCVFRGHRAVVRGLADQAPRARFLARRDGREGRAARLSRVVPGQERHVRAQRSVAGEAAGRRARAGREPSSGRSSMSSAIRFFLVFNTKLKIFHYVLDETGTGRRPVLLAARSATASWSASAPALRSTRITG